MGVVYGLAPNPFQGEVNRAVGRESAGMEADIRTVAVGRVPGVLPSTEHVRLI